MLRQTTASTTPAASTIPNIHRQFSRSIGNVSSGTAMKLPRDAGTLRKTGGDPRWPMPNQCNSARPRQLGSAANHSFRTLPVTSQRIECLLVSVDKEITFWHLLL